jgi:DNA-binding transcriptional MocR family regulator
MLDLAQYQTGGSMINGSTAREIAASAEAAIREGLLDTGAVLPTVRALAERLGTSPATVNSAYRILRERGLVIADGRRGTRVAPRPPVRTPQPAELPSHLRDLSIGLPDPEFLPPLAPVLARIDVDRKLRMSGLEAADPELLEAAASSFAGDGIPGDALAVLGGAFDGIERVLMAHLRPGDRVIVEDPAYISISDLLLALGLVPVPVPVDEYGLLPEPFEAALAKGADAAVIVPRAQNPLGAAFDEERARTLRGLLDPHPELLLVEDDHAWLVSGVEFATLIDPARPRWALIRSVSKMLHPDLRTALMAGDRTTIARVEGRQALGPRWVSHVLQAVVAELLRDPSFPATAARAADAYAARRQALIGALAAQGVTAYGRSGLNVWAPVREEAAVARALLNAGWLVSPGERFRFAAGPGIRITTATLPPGDAAEIAQIIAGAEHAGRPRGAY